VGTVPPGLRVDYSVVELSKIGRGRPAPAPPTQGDEAAVLFTSGSTGPAKGVVYRHAQLEAQRDQVAAAFDVTDDDRFVAAFAPFALFGPALGITSVVPFMDVTEPGTLSATALADAVAAIDATMVFAAPAALLNVDLTSRALRTRHREALTRIRLLISAGAPVPSVLLRRVSDLLGHCDAHTPYGMTEALPVCDVTLDELEKVGLGNGVLVGRPLDGVQVAVSPLSWHGVADGALTDDAAVTGEVCVRGPHVKDRYDQLWCTQRESTRDIGWHRTGDVGHLDDEGRLWIEGRLGHLIATADGVVTPVGVERVIAQVPDVTLAAAVGVGPVGAQVVVAVVQAPRIHPGAAPLELIDAVRESTSIPICAVLVVRELPVDIRHNSKIDRTRVAAWAAHVLAGQESSRL
jgi:acyl-CoA synthetase (AMP-forming)/AMP-acid ligase II